MSNLDGKKERRYTNNKANKKFRLCREYLLQVGCHIDNFVKLQFCEKWGYPQPISTTDYHVYDELYFECDCGNIDIEYLSKQCKYNERRFNEKSLFSEPP